MCQTYSRTYPKIQDALANVGGALKAILFIADFINFIFNQWTIILDVQYECENLGLDYSFFGKKKLQLRKSGNMELQLNTKNDYMKNNSNSATSKNKNSSGIPLAPSINYQNNLENKFKTMNNNSSNFHSRNPSQGSINSIFTTGTPENKESATNLQILHKKKIKLWTFIKSIFIEKIKDKDTNIRVMHKFWINKISEENIVQMDLKLFKLSPKYVKFHDVMHINNLIDDYKE